MRRSTFAILVLLLIAPTSGYGGKFEVTENLTPAPVEINQTIVRLHPSYSHCVFTGKHFDLDGDGESTDYIATATGCGSSGNYPIFLLKLKNDSFVEVLQCSGYALTTENNTAGGLNNISVSAEAGDGRTFVTLWVYNGQHYDKKRGRVLEIFQ
jgi:hypothetical protein